MRERAKSNLKKKKKRKEMRAWSGEGHGVQAALVVVGWGRGGSRNDSADEMTTMLCRK